MSKADVIKANSPDVWLSIARRFPQFVDQQGPDECWKWTGARNEHRYGKIATNRKYGPVRATHVAWALAGESLPDGFFLLHSCDNRPCVNPNHLRVGTCKENHQDLVQRGNPSKPPIHIAEKHPKANLTREQVQAILSDSRLSSHIAKDYGVSYMTIYQIKRGNHWGCFPKSA